MIRDFILLDLDGTIIDSYHSTLSAIEQSIADLDLPVPYELYQQKEVGQMMSVIERNLPHTVPFHSFKSRFDSCLRRNPLEGVKVTLEGKHLLSVLKEQGFKLVVLTNKRQDTAEIICSSLFPEGTFVSVVGRKTLQPLKPTIQVVEELAKIGVTASQIKCMIGDSEKDKLTASILNIEYKSITNVIESLPGFS